MDFTVIQNAATKIVDNFKSVNNNIDDLKDRADTLEQDVAVLDSRMDVFTALPEGATTNDAALEDIKVGYDGTVYDGGPGDAVRAQVSQLHSEIDSTNDKIKAQCKRTYQLYNKDDGVLYMAFDGSIFTNSVNKNSMLILIPNLGDKRYVFRIDNVPNAIAAATYIRCTKSDSIPAHGSTATSGNVVKETNHVYGVFPANLTGSYASVIIRFTDADTLNLYRDEILNNFVIAEKEKGYDIPYIDYYVLNITEENFPNYCKNNWKDKTLWWCGTSIPAGVDTSIGVNGITYPQMVGEKLGATTINVSIGSSMCRANTRYGDYTDGVSHNILRAFSATKEEKQSIFADWENVRQKLRDKDTYTTLSESVKSMSLSSSFEEILLPYLNGINPMPDLFVIDHGHNDWKYTLANGNSDIGLEPTAANITSGELAEDTYMVANGYEKLKYYFGDVSKIPNLPDFVASINRNCYKGAINFICTLILMHNPRAKIVFIGNLDRSKDELISAQQDNAESWCFPISEPWRKLRFGNHYIPNTATYWDTNGIVDLTQKNIYCKDNVHPHSDTTGESLQLYADIVANDIRQFV